jgi:phosphopantothenoylcysteine decarboxylase/phosphopantothenate--cysteine ligase
MKVLVTCGPSYEPIDAVRRLTNFSTGELGVKLAGRLAQEGFEVVCLKGEGAVHPDAAVPVETVRFGTNDALWMRLEGYARAGGVGAVFHAAALCDYGVVGVEDEAGRALTALKIPSRGGSLRLKLAPVRKVIAGLRTLFPRSWLVGWKYEVEGTREEVVARGWAQLAECATDVCVVNGPAVGQEFGLCVQPDRVTWVQSKAAAVEALTAAWVARGASRAGT